MSSVGIIMKDMLYYASEKITREQFENTLRESRFEDILPPLSMLAIILNKYGALNFYERYFNEVMEKKGNKDALTEFNDLLITMELYRLGKLTLKDATEAIKKIKSKISKDIIIEFILLVTDDLRTTKTGPIIVEALAIELRGRGIITEDEYKDILKKIYGKTDECCCCKK